MKKFLSLILVLSMVLSLAAVFTACGDDEKQTEKQTDKSPEKQTEKSTEKQTEKSTEKQTEKQTEKAGEGDTEKQAESETEEVKAPEVKIAPNDEANLVKLYKEKAFRDYDITYLCPDFMCGGGIYAITEATYNELLTLDTEERPYDGWIRCDGDIIGFDFAGSFYPLNAWGPSCPYDIRPLIKSIDGCYFLWLHGSFSFGDRDGGWVTHDERLQWTIDDEVRYSNMFTVHVADVGKLDGHRNIQWVAEDKDLEGFIYSVTKDIAESWKLTSETADMFGITWTKLDNTGMYYIFSSMGDGYHDWADDTTLYEMAFDELEENDGYKVYLGQKDGSYYMWCANAAELQYFTLDDRVVLCWNDGGTKRSEMFYHFVGTNRSGYDMPAALVKF